MPMGFLAALQFLTIMPPLVRRSFTPKEMGRAVGWFAAVGLLLGAGLVAAEKPLGYLFPPGVSAALLLAMWVLAAGALHLDGFLDTCDGLFGGRSPEARLRIMRDHRVGAFAVIGGILLFLIKYSSLVAITNRGTALILAPAIGRWGVATAVVVFPYARPEGLGRWMKDHAGLWQVALATTTALATAVLVGKWLGLLAMVIAALTIVVGSLLVLSRLPGHTGDTYGAICEVVETITLLSFVAAEKLVSAGMIGTGW
jgi:adenosylcobinamide-GDP ribazoletransferase